jgi:hypothetical protein
MRIKIPVVVISIFAIVILAAFAAYLCGHHQFATFTINSLVSVSTLTAVLVALYGDRIKERFNRIRLKMEEPAANNIFDRKAFAEGAIKDVYCHHLQIRVLTPDKTVKNCIIWLTRIFLQSELDKKWEEPVRFAVPRMMVWAPVEFSPDRRTFNDTQVFDLGKTIANNVGFEIGTWEGQGGNFNRMIAPGRRAGLVFRVSAENIRDKEFCVEVYVPIAIGNKCNPTIVRVVENPEWWPQ